MSSEVDIYQDPKKKKRLLEKWSPILAGGKRTEPIKDISLAASMAMVLENTEIERKRNGRSMLTEENASADIGIFTPILIPALRRIYPQLLAHKVVGVQPMSAPTGYAFAQRFGYAGSDSAPIQTLSSIDRSGNANQSNPNSLYGTSFMPAQFGSVAVMFPIGTTVAVGDTINVAGGGATLGTVVYAEQNRVLVSLATVGGSIPIGVNAVSINAPTASTSVVNYDVVYTIQNEAGYNLIFQNYAGPYTTAVGETQGTNMSQMKMTIERASVEAVTRVLKTEYTIEMVQDLQAMHGLDAENEIINMLQYEIVAELDRELLTLMISNATVATPWSYNLDSEGTPGADGRWLEEKIRTLYAKIQREQNLVAITTRKGYANWMICSLNVATALQNLNNFFYSNVENDIQQFNGITYVGTLDNRLQVFVDTFAGLNTQLNGQDYILLGYKGGNELDTGVVYCPYLPLMLMQAVNYNSFQPIVGVKSRYGITANLYGVWNYMRVFTVDLTGSSFGGSYYSGSALGA